MKFNVFILGSIVATAIAISACQMLPNRATNCPFCDGYKTVVRDTSVSGMSECTACKREFPAWMANPRFAVTAREQARRELEVAATSFVTE